MVNKYKEYYIRDIKRRLHCAKILKTILYASAGAIAVLTRWYIGLPLLLLFIFLGDLVEDRQKKFEKELEK